MAFSNGLKVSYEETKAAGSKVVQLEEELKAINEEIRKQNNIIAENYIDEGMKIYTDSVTEQANKIDKILDSIGETGNFVRAAGQAYEDVANENRSYFA